MTDISHCTECGNALEEASRFRYTCGAESSNAADVYQAPSFPKGPPSGDPFRKSPEELEHIRHVDTIRLRRPIEATVHKIDGRPWWFADRDQIVLSYTDMGQIEFELKQASKRGWFIETTDSTDGHINVGRTMSAAILTGGLSLAFGASRTSGRTTVNWRRQSSEVAQTPPSIDPLEMLKKLNELKEAGVITEAEFEAKKGEILARL